MIWCLLWQSYKAEFPGLGLVVSLPAFVSGCPQGYMSHFRCSECFPWVEAWMSHLRKNPRWWESWLFTLFSLFQCRNHDLGKSFHMSGAMQNEGRGAIDMKIWFSYHPLSFFKLSVTQEIDLSSYLSFDVLLLIISVLYIWFWSSGEKGLGSKASLYLFHQFGTRSLQVIYKKQKRISHSYGGWKAQNQGAHRVIAWWELISHRWYHLGVLTWQKGWKVQEQGELPLSCDFVGASNHTPEGRALIT